MRPTRLGESAWCRHLWLPDGLGFNLPLLRPAILARLGVTFLRHS